MKKQRYLLILSRTIVRPVALLDKNRITAGGKANTLKTKGLDKVIVEMPCVLGHLS